MAEPTVPVPINPRDAARLGFRSEQHMQRVGNRFFAQRAARQKALREACDPDLIFSDTMSQLLVICGVSVAEQNLRDEITQWCHEMALRVYHGEECSYEEAYENINRIAEEHGFLSGVPVPIMGAEFNPDLVMARGVPLAEIFSMNQELQHAQRDQQPRTEAEMILRRAKAKVRNSWDVLGDRTISVLETTGGPIAWTDYHAGRRMRKALNGAIVRRDAHQRAEAELKAMDSLRKRLSEGQWESYVLSGVFPEHSKRSDLYYYFRKGLPTLAVSYHGKKAESAGGRVLCALCLHPMGYYQGTHCGLMCPTDEVIAHLLLMRADEHTFWKKSGQWRPEDTRSGI